MQNFKASLGLRAAKNIPETFNRAFISGATFGRVWVAANNLHRIAAIWPKYGFGKAQLIGLARQDFISQL